MILYLIGTELVDQSILIMVPPLLFVENNFC